MLAAIIAEVSFERVIAIDAGDHRFEHLRE